MPADADEPRQAGRSTRARPSLRAPFLAASAAALGLAVLALIALIVLPNGVGSPQPVAARPTESGSEARATPTPTPTPARAGGPSPAPVGLGTCRRPRRGGETFRFTAAQEQRFERLLTRYKAVLAEHLDPGYRHLERGVSGLHVGCESDARWALGAKFAWTEGRAGGQLDVTVASRLSLHEPYLGCGDGWVCKPVAHRGAGITRARVGTFDSGFAVIIERTGGETVMIIADRGFGNDFTAAIDGFPFEVDELVAAASDPRLDLAP